MNNSAATTPPSPRQDSEEPELAQEHDIPIDDGEKAGSGQRGRANDDGRDTATPERE